MHALVRKSSFSKAQGFRETGSSTTFVGSLRRKPTEADVQAYFHFLYVLVTTVVYGLSAEWQPCVHAAC